MKEKHFIARRQHSNFVRLSVRLSVCESHSVIK